jgi:methyl-accepting chemotaxis protein
VTQSAETVTRLAGEVQAESLSQAQNLESIAERIDQMRRVTEEAAAGPRKAPRRARS